jgi:hypothetical protein
MKKPLLRIEEQQPRNIQRDEIAPVDGYAMIVDGHLKAQFADENGAQTAPRKHWGSSRCCKLKSAMAHRRLGR